MFVCWLIGIPQLQHGYVLSLLFFGIGGFLAIHNLDDKIKVVLKTSKKTTWVCGIAMAICLVIQNNVDEETGLGIAANNVLLTVGTVFYTLLFYHLPETRTTNLLKSWAQYSFFIFCVHELFIIPVHSLVKPIMGVSSFSFLVSFLLVASVSFMTAWLIKKIFPTAFRLLSGER